MNKEFLCSSQPCIYGDDIKEIKENGKELKKILNGNGKAGLVAKVEFHDEYIRGIKKANIDIYTFIFRTIIGILIAYIAYKVGLKP